MLAGVFVATATGSADAHINPAVTIGFALASGSWDKVAVYLPAQFLGAFIGGVIVWLHYLPHWTVTDDPGLKLAVFCTGPAIRNYPANFISEVIGTFFLLFVIAAIASKTVGGTGGMAPGMIPYLVAMLVWGIGLSLGGTTGYAINPARDLGPRTRPCCAANSRQGPVRLGLCHHSGGGAGGRRAPRRRRHSRRRNPVSGGRREEAHQCA